MSGSYFGQGASQGFGDPSTGTIVQLTSQGTNYRYGAGQAPGISFVNDQDRNAALPEPASWAMMLVGFGAIGTAVRRRRPVPLPV